MSRRTRLISGIFLLLLFGGILAILTPFTFGRVLLDLDGSTVRGAVTGKRVATIASRWRGRSGSHHVAVAFRTRAGRDLETEYSVTRETYEATERGQAVNVTYWAPEPLLSAIEPTPWDDTVFLILFGLATCLLWLCVMVVFRTCLPPRSNDSS